MYGISFWTYPGSGAFYLGNNGPGTSARGTAGTQEKYMMFNASRCFTIYGNSTTVQPASILVYMWKRIN